ncbi:DUF1349 domain-containing protein [Micromonospora sp. M12]
MCRSRSCPRPPSCGGSTRRPAPWRSRRSRTRTSSSTPAPAPPTRPRPPRSAPSRRSTRRRCWGPAGGDFQFSARVTVDFAATFDAGVLLLWLDERHWGKLCFEFSPAGEPMIVSVICRGVADDANAFVVPDRTVWLRVSRVDRVYAYHASVDGETWQLIRVFLLDHDTSRDRIGFAGQSPTGEGAA